MATMTDLTPAHLAMLRAFDQLLQRHQVATIQAAAIVSGETYMRAYDITNELFGAGLLNHELKPTDAGRSQL